ncbi:50S ribosomal protein L32 [Nocardia spumae]|uniref:50S ribosomal protein L32 n=1 Tax=Nocardia spumae TaxID=2887190 RepID=UPI001D138F2A|nr:50S ribosomal protein L32 [Nocardia spumae]
MAVPKRRMSRANTRSRRSNWKAKPPDLVPISVGGAVYRIPRRLVAGVRRGVIDPTRL